MPRHASQIRWAQFYSPYNLDMNIANIDQLISVFETWGNMTPEEADEWRR